MRHDAYRRLPAATTAASVDRSGESKIKSEVGKKKDKTRQDKTRLEQLDGSRSGAKP
jgi:hypothetical protein